ncbi:hypothetical protein BGX38DRAFT_1226953 [Terfezia claveryi]|nr:hypothetical protein BGX38DRAFT_1226953 [Terfezia claveryi]
MEQRRDPIFAGAFVYRLRTRADGQVLRPSPLRPDVAVTTGFTFTLTTNDPFHEAGCTCS